MKKHCITLYLIYFIVTSADLLESKVKSKSLKQINAFLDVLGTDESSHRTYFIPKEGSYGKSMNDSINKCDKLGLRLVTMDSKAEQEWLLQALYKSNVGYGRSYVGFYIGLIRGTNATWNRINNLGVIDFDLNFHYGEPNNQSGIEDCIEILSYHDQRQFELNDIPCITESKSFVCVLVD